MTRAQHGLALGQRRVLLLLADPCALEELAARHALDPERLARDLAKLAARGLVTLDFPGGPPPVAPQPRGPSEMRPVAIVTAVAAVLVAVAWVAAR